MKSVPASGYSPRSLSQKLGLKPGMNATSVHAPKEYKDWLGPDAAILKAGPPPWDFVHLFTHTTSDLEEQLMNLRSRIKEAGIIWVSWYKKSSGRSTEITENIIRDTCLPLGLVDIKVCAVSPEWSGLKLMIRKKLR